MNIHKWRNLKVRCVRMLSDSWSFPDSRHTLGCSTIGSSEAAMLGRLALKWQWCKNAKYKVNQPNLICDPVQICCINSAVTVM